MRRGPRIQKSRLDGDGRVDLAWHEWFGPIRSPTEGCFVCAREVWTGCFGPLDKLVGTFTTLSGGAAPPITSAVEFA